MKTKHYPIFTVLLAGFFIAGCGDTTEPEETSINGEEVVSQSTNSPAESKGIGPIKELVLGELSEKLVADGKAIYDAKCTACHNISAKLIGPPQAGVLDRRTPEWVMNMILNPSEMIKKDPIAKALLKEFNNVPMTEQGLSEQDARAILEYFRTI